MWLSPRPASTYGLSPRRGWLWEVCGRAGGRGTFPGRALLARLDSNCPRAVWRDVLPAHRDDLLAPLRRQQQQANERAKRAIGLARLPHRANLVVGENTAAGAFLRVGAPHALDDRRHV